MRKRFLTCVRTCTYARAHACPHLDLTANILPCLLPFLSAVSVKVKTTVVCFCLGGMVKVHFFPGLAGLV